jgi:glycosyltransferase involved in cell wall biosynthesis
MSCGKPIITTDIPGCREAVDNGVNGLLVPAMDVDSLSDAMLTLAEDDDLRKRMGKASRERVMRLFSDNIVIEKTLNVYNQAGLIIGAHQSQE